MRDDDGPPGGSPEQPTDRPPGTDPARDESDPSRGAGARDARSGRTRDGTGRRSDGTAGQPGRGGAASGGSDGGKGDGWTVYAMDLLSSVGIVVVIGGLLFAASGIWPPMVAVESPSMEPVLERGDLVYVMESDRFPGPNAQDETGVVTAESAREAGYRTFGGYGDVIIFEPGGDSARTPIIHRAMLYVEEGERWYDRANESYLGLSGGCERLDDCPAPYDGFITKGDNNRVYDQVAGSRGRGQVVRPEWVIGTAEVHVPYLGQIRLRSAGATGTTAPVDADNATVPVGG